MTSPQPRPHRCRNLALGAALLAAVALVWRACTPESLDVTFLDVGQGDAVLIAAPGGRTALVDAGASDPVGMLLSRGVEHIDLLVASHPHADHIGGMDEVVEALPVRAYLDNGTPHTTDAYSRLMRAVEARSSITYLGPGQREIRLGDASLEVLPAYSAARHLNDGSLALLVRYGDFSVLLTGDAETAALTHLVRSGTVSDVTVLKASHHGSDNGFTDGLLTVARPEVVVISVGSGNAFGHPGPLAVSAYYGAATEVYRTDLDGTVTVRGFSDGTYRVSTER